MYNVEYILLGLLTRMLCSLYRQGTDDVAHISKQVLQDLYLIVRKNVAQVLALALSIADSKDIAYSPVSSSGIRIIKRLPRLTAAQ